MKNVIFVVDPNPELNAQFGFGLSVELQQNGPWNVILQRPSIAPDAFRDLLAKAKPEAIVARNLPPYLQPVVQQSGIPYIAILYRLENPVQTDDDPPYIVNPDEQAIGKMAAKYLLSLGFPNYAVVSHIPPNPGNRISTFVNAIEADEQTVNQYIFKLLPTYRGSTTELLDRTQLQMWLHALPKPCAVFTYADYVGSEVVATCGWTGVRVPDDVSVLSVEDNLLHCHAVMPNLASIRLAGQRIGTEAARIILNRPAGRLVVNVPPSILVERGSCRAPHQSDPLVDKALAYLRTHVEENVKVRDLRKITGLTASQLLYRFQKSTGYAPMEMIMNNRIARAKQLLVETTDPIASISARCGFSSPNLFYLAFLEAVGTSPGEFRNRIEQGNLSTTLLT
jgi:LacI family transcriptional regulator